jgi:hypothetical protein
MPCGSFFWLLAELMCCFAEKVGHEIWPAVRWRPEDTAAPGAQELLGRGDLGGYTRCGKHPTFRHPTLPTLPTFASPTTAEDAQMQAINARLHALLGVLGCNEYLSALVMTECGLRALIQRRGPAMSQEFPTSQHQTSETIGYGLESQHTNRHPQHSDLPDTALPTEP